MEDKNLNNQEPEGEFELEETTGQKVKNAGKKVWRVAKYIVTAAIGWLGKSLFDRVTGKDDDDDDSSKEENEEETSEE